jgi:nucleoporin NUP159
VARQVWRRYIQRTLRLADSSLHLALILSPLADLRSALAAASAEDEHSYRPQRRVPINGAPPHILTFACNDTRVLLGLVDGSIYVYASDQLVSGGEGPVQPIHVFSTSSSTTLLSIQPNPGDIPELIAVLRDCANSPGSLAVELFDVQKLISSGGWLASESPSTTPTSSAYGILQH